jgi:hypothetical protein
VVRNCHQTHAHMTAPRTCMAVRSYSLTVSWGSAAGAAGFSTNELPAGSSTISVNGSSDPVISSASRAITTSICPNQIRDARPISHSTARASMPETRLIDG